MTISTARRAVPHYHDLPWYWQYGECRRHREFTKKQARFRARAHEQNVRDGAPCAKCRQGRKPTAFRCPEGGKHFHWAHGTPPEAARV